MSARLAAILAALALAGPAAAAAPLPTRSGEGGLLDVPDADVQGVGNGLLGAELRLDHVAGLPTRSGPLPIAAVAGVTDRLDLGLSLRQWGQPGDPVSEQLLFGLAGKLQLVAPAGWVPGLAVDATLDRLNADPALGSRLVLSTGRGQPLRLAAVVGGETSFGVTPAGVTYGGAVAFSPASAIESVLEGYGGPRGTAIGGAIRWAASPTIGLQLSLTWLPKDDGFRLALGVGFGPKPKPRAEAAPAVAPAEPEAPAPEGALAATWEDRPRFRLKIHTYEPSLLGRPRHLQVAPYVPPTAVAAAPPRLTAPPRGAGVASGGVLEAQLKDQELQAAAQLKRLRGSDDELDGREATDQAEARRLAGRADQLAAREQQLDARERRIQLRGAPTQAQRSLESQEAQLAATERQLAATERGVVPALDAALGSERDAAGREQVERSERERLTALAGLEKVKARQLDLRRQAVAAAQRLLAAMEARLVAKGDRLDAVERQLRTRAERLDAMRRRLDARAERLDGMEKRALDQQRGIEGERPAPAPAQPKDKAVFVMVVKSPTAIMKEPVAKEAGPGARREVIHPGMDVEKAVAAATVVTFTSPASRLSELDRESIDGIARLAAREGCELLIWARAKDPGLMSEAIRRSEEIKGYVISSASLSPRQVVTRITTRPGAQGVDVVVSALRETGRTGPPVPAPAPQGAPPARPVDRLAGGETTRRQIRDSVLAVQPSIERCVGEQMLRRGLSLAEGTLKLSVNAQGRVTDTSTGAGQLGGPELEECLRAASTGWLFPAADTAYTVDVPITVVRGGAAR